MCFFRSLVETRARSGEELEGDQDEARSAYEKSEVLVQKRHGLVDQSILLSLLPTLFPSRALSHLLTVLSYPPPPHDCYLV